MLSKLLFSPLQLKTLQLALMPHFLSGLILQNSELGTLQEPFLDALSLRLGKNHIGHCLRGRVDLRASQRGQPHPGYKDLSLLYS